MVPLKAADRNIEGMKPYLDRTAATGRSQVAAIGVAQKMQRVLIARQRGRSARAAPRPPPCPCPPAPDPARLAFLPPRRAALSPPAGASGVVLSSTFTGVSSAASAFSAASAASIASSNPALPSCAASRALALSTQPGETGIPSSMAMTCAARSGGTPRNTCMDTFK